MGGIDGVRGKKVGCMKERDGGIKLEREKRGKEEKVCEKDSEYVCDSLTCFEKSGNLSLLLFCTLVHACNKRSWFQKKKRNQTIA